MFKIFFAFGILLLPNFSQSKTICDEYKVNKLLLASPSTLDEANFNKALELSQVVIVGEHHHDFTKATARIDLLKQFSKHSNEPKCLALEIPKSKDFPTLLKRLEELHKKFSNDAKIVKDAKSKKELDALHALVEELSFLNTEAVKLNIKVYGVDTWDNWDKDVAMKIRNQEMTKNLQSLLTNRECKSILFFTGKSHLANTKEYEGVPSLLHKSRIKTLSINLQMTDEKEDKILKSWNVCNSDRKKITDYIVFSNSLIENDIVLYPNDPSPSNRWKDYDFTVLVP